MNPPGADLDMLEALLASMQQSNTQNLYDDPDDDDDDDYEDDEDDDDDDEYGEYGEHTINTLLNPYGGGNNGGGGGGGESPDGEIGGNGGNVQLSMNFLQSLLNMNSSAIPGMDAEGMGNPMSGGLGGMSVPMEGGSGGFLPSMQNLLPNMNSEMAGALAGAFGSIGAFMDYGSGSNSQDYDDDDDDALTDDEEEDDEDEDDDASIDDDKHELDSGIAVAGGALGGLLTAGLISAAATNSSNNNFREPYHNHPMPPPNSLPALPAPPPSQPAPLGFTVPVPLPPKSANNALFTPVTSTIPMTSNIAATSTNLTNTSGGTVSKVDPLAALVSGIGGVCLGASILAPIVTNSMGNGGGTTVVNKLNTSDVSTIIGSPNESFSSNNRTLVEDNTPITAAAAIAAVAHAVSAPIPTRMPQDSSKLMIQAPKAQLNMLPPTSMANTQQLINKMSKDDSDDDKASLGSDITSGSVRSGGGKSDTESVGKKTPSPVPEGTESTHGREEGSCSSITDLASATESMRDSDTDNHSEVHNVTANLSDFDSDIQEHQRIHTPSHYAPVGVGALPIIIERPTYGWGSMQGLDNAKEALKSLFYARSFPEVFEGTEGICKGILLFGPSGSGKTCLARALAKEANNSLFVGINSSYLLRHHPLDVTRLVRCMFDEARLNKPAVILFDEIECLSYPNNESAIRAKDEILAQVRGTTYTRPGYPVQQPNDGVLVLATTNQPWLLEDRMRRLFAYNIHVKLPGEKARHQLFRMFLQNSSHAINEEQFRCIVSKSDSYSAADINTVIRQASHHRVVPYQSSNSTAPHLLTYDDLASCMTEYKCRFNDDLKERYTSYIRAATHKSEDPSEKDKKDKPKGVKKFSQRIAKAMAAAVLAVID